VIRNKAQNSKILSK